MQIAFLSGGPTKLILHASRRDLYGREVFNFAKRKAKWCRQADTHSRKCSHGYLPASEQRTEDEEEEAITG